MFGVPWATLLVMTGIPAALAELRRCLPASMSAAVAFLIGYFVAMLGIGFWAARRTGASDE